MVVADAAGIGLMLAGAANNDIKLGFISWAGYALSGPIVHWANGEGARGMGSLGLRIGLPLAGALIGGSLPSRCDNCGGESLGLAPAVPGMLVGAAVGALLASVIDIGFLAGHDAPRTRDPGRVTWLFGGNSVAMSARF